MPVPRGCDYSENTSIGTHVSPCLAQHEIPYPHHVRDILMNYTSDSGHLELLDSSPHHLSDVVIDDILDLMNSI